MNNINFTGRNNFPLSVETMTFLQEMIGTVGTLALLGGDTYILSGCQTTDLTVSSGYVVINGEILKFTGGALQEYVYIKETKRTVIAQGYTFPEVYNTRTVELGYDDTRYKWENFKRLSTNMQLADAISNINTTIEGLQGTPKGIIAMWAGSANDIPNGWALCAGQEAWIPNLSGRFVVGYNKNDDDYNQIGKTGGVKETILTNEQMPKHRHTYTDDVYANGAFSGIESGFPNAYDEKTSSISGEKKGQGRAYYTTYSGESKPIDLRPPYYVLAYIIKL